MGVSLQIKIESENAAFEEENAAAETARLLRKAADEIEANDGADTLEFNLRDVNGNKCGSVYYGAWNEENE